MVNYSQLIMIKRTRTLELIELIDFRKFLDIPLFTRLRIENRHIKTVFLENRILVRTLVILVRKQRGTLEGVHSKALIFFSWEEISLLKMRFPDG